eukprot:Clim_evm27s142 gene=Clim_evmTU27s142
MMKNIAITGGTNGFGFALTVEFLKHGHAVCIAGSSEQTVAAAINHAKTLVTPEYAQNLHGVACDLSTTQGPAYFVKEAEKWFMSKYNRTLEIVVANAGLSAKAHYKPLVDDGQTAEDIAKVLNVNLTGVIILCRETMRAWQREISAGRRPGGQFKIILIGGAGTRGNATGNSLVYGASKAGYNQLAGSLRSEIKDNKDHLKGNVGVHILTPGMVLTNLLLRDAKPSSLKIFNILCETPETAATWAMPRILKCKGPGTAFNYLTIPGAIFRFATFLFRRNRFFDGDGNKRYTSIVDDLNSNNYGLPPPRSHHGENSPLLSS